MSTSSPANSYEDLAAGLSAFDQHYSSVAERNTRDQQGLAHSLRTLPQALEVLRARHEANLRASKGRFNLFTALLTIGDETGLHSRWLAYLLNPQEAHDCGPLFLQLFLDNLWRRGVQLHADDAERDHLPAVVDLSCDQARVRFEVPVDEGRLDILIEIPGWGRIAIENKIWAGEQHKQLERYAEFLQREGQSKGGKALLLFLTLDGKQSKTAGKFSGRYRRISYREHILPWLEECLRATYAFVNVNQALQQYRAVVSQLSGTASNDEYMEQIIELLKEHPSIIRHLTEINSAYERMRMQYWADFGRELRKELQERGIECGAAQMDTNYPKIVIHERHSFPFDGTRHFRVMIEWDKGGSHLFVGASLHHYDEKLRREAAQSYQKFSAVTGAWAGVFSDRFKGGGANWWPLGILTLQPGFLNHAFVSDHCGKHSPPVHDFVCKIADDIAQFIRCASGPKLEMESARTI